jgi:hypothetical protein
MIGNVCGCDFVQNAKQNYNIWVGNKFFENMAELIYLGMTVRNKIAHVKKLRTD